MSHDTKEQDLSISLDMQQALQELQDAHGAQGSGDLQRSCISMALTSGMLADVSSCSSACAAGVAVCIAHNPLSRKVAYVVCCS